MTFALYRTIAEHKLHTYTFPPKQKSFKKMCPSREGVNGAWNLVSIFQVSPWSVSLAKYLKTAITADMIGVGSNKRSRWKMIRWLSRIFWWLKWICPIFVDMSRLARYIHKVRNGILFGLTSFAASFHSTLQCCYVSYSELQFIFVCTAQTLLPSLLFFLPCIQKHKLHQYTISSLSGT